MRVRSGSGPSGYREWLSSHPRLRPLLLNLGLVLAALLVAGGVAEVALRNFFRPQLALVDDERKLLYRYDSNLGWFPIPGSAKQLLASRVFAAAHNSRGFRDIEETVPRQNGVVFLGDSFVWGYDVDAAERFTDKFRARHPEWPVHNLGVSGYGTDQEFLLLQTWFDEFKPRVVFLVFCVETDHDDNWSNVRYEGYYKPYFTMGNGQLQLQGVPVPQSEKVFWAEHALLSHSYVARLLARGWFRLNHVPELKNPDPTAAILQCLNDFVRSKGAVLCVGLTRSDPPVQQVLERLKVPWVDLSTPLRYPQFGNHWTPEGHTFVCEKIEAFISSPPK